MTRNHVHRLGGLFAAALIVTSSTGANAQTLIGAAQQSPETYRIDVGNQQTTLIGQYQLVDPQHELGIGALARAPDGTLYGISSSALLSRLYRFDDVTGVATAVHDITTGPVLPVGAAFDPASGLLYFLNTFGFAPWASLSAINIQTGKVFPKGNIGPLPLGDVYAGLAFVPGGPMVSLNLTQATLWSVDKNDPLNNSGPIGAGLGTTVDVSQGATVTFDKSSGNLFGYEAGGTALFGIDPVTGLAGPKGSSLAPMFVSIAGSSCGGLSLQYGTGCAGGGAQPIPNLTLSGCPEAGNLVSLQVTNGLGGSTAVLFFGQAQGSTPVGFGCNLLVQPLLPLILSVPLGGVGPGNGSVIIPGIIPANAAGASITSQAIVIDPLVPRGATSSNGIDVAIE